MVELLIGSDGRAERALIVRKHLEDPIRLTHQVRWLTRAQGPGVVRLHDVGPNGEHYSTEFGGPLTLAAATDPAATLPVVNAVWAGIDRLHRLGLTHGAVAAEHVVIGTGGPLLISPGGPEPLGRRHDIASFGRMIAGLAEVWSVEAIVDPAIAAHWNAIGRRLTELGDPPDIAADDRLVSGAEVRRLLGVLGPVG
ncbi:MAG: hypothetical protein OEZ14_14110, partial [Acidimicrobiia bacterium]|nr:hypothetical protein [Acidimicrobiia bacterium]